MATARIPRVSTRIRRTSPRQGPRAPMHLVERMQVAVIGLVNAYIDRLMREIDPALRRRFDAESFPVGHVGGQVALGHQFLETTFRLVDRQAAHDLARVLPVPTDAVLRHAGKLQQEFIRNNTELIRLEERARAEVRGVIEGPLREGVRVEEVRKKIEERLGVVRSRAELIARDQTLKLYGQIQEARQTAAGIEEYTWSTSEDERVRAGHEHLEGTTQRWDNPPIVDPKTGRKAHPGGDFQCRCAAIPILPVEGLEEQESPREPRPLLPTEPETTPANEIEPAPPEPAAKAVEHRVLPGEAPAQTVDRITSGLEAVDTTAIEDAPQAFIAPRRVAATRAYDRLERDQQRAVDAYTQSSYKAIRALQAGAAAEEVAQTLMVPLGRVRELERLLEPLRIAQATTLRVANPVAERPLYRGFGVDAATLAHLLTKDTLILGHGTSSTTYDISTALDFADSGLVDRPHQVVLRINELSEAATAMYGANPNARENEMLVDERKFVVTGRRYDKLRDVYFIDIAEAPKADHARDKADAERLSRQERARAILRDRSTSRFVSDGSDLIFP